MTISYDQSRTTRRRPTPLLGLARAIQDALQGLSIGWQDCGESLQDWWLYLRAPLHMELLGKSPFFVLLGQPIGGANEYHAPWDDYLDYLADEDWFEEIGEKLYV